jgi:dienelactone hydrolase
MTIRWDMADGNCRQMPVDSALPERPGPTPTVLVAMHGLGLDAPMLDVVHRLHRAGYAVAMPDLSSSAYHALTFNVIE